VGAYRNAEEKDRNSGNCPGSDPFYICSAISVPLLKVEVCHLSPAYFSRLFAKEMGESPSVYLSRKKIQHACDLLENSELSINQISDELNFSSPGYFIKVFKKFEGITPLVYRKYYQDSESNQ